MNLYSVTDVGRKRKVNQDYVYVSDQPVGNLPNLFVVADGMGGHNAGDFASSFAVKIVVEAVKTDADYNPVKIIRHAIETANDELINQAERCASMAGMGTTIVVTTIVGNYVYVANVGDSRLYLMDSKLRQITKDHSLVQEMVRLGELREEEARNHPDKNIITRALGAKRGVNIDFFGLKLEPGSQILMCSDGLSNMLTDQEMEEILRGSDSLQKKGEKLIELANENGGRDNIAVILIEPFTSEVKVC